jgi:CelD/BcsL family acetyltransferase involved in cellulose biosynthesis
VLVELAPSWQRLLEEGGRKEPFHRPEWIAAWVRAFAPGEPIVAITAERSGALRGILPLRRVEARIAGLRARTLSSTANVHSFRFDAIQGSGDEPRAIAGAMWRALAELDGWDAIVLYDVPVDGTAQALLDAARADGFPAAAWSSIRSPYLDLPPSGVTAKFRANLRRRRRNLEALGALEHTRTASGDSGFERFLALEERGWKGAEKSAIACQSSTWRFYGDVVRLAAERGELAINALELDGEPIAMHLALECGGTYYLLKTTYDERWSTASPGQLLVDAVLEEGQARGLTRFDFLGPSMDWKRAWSGRERAHSVLYLFRSGAFGRLLFEVKFGAAREAFDRTRALIGRGRSAERC